MAAVRGRCIGPTTRRSFLTAGTLALGGLSLADLAKLRAASSATAAAADTSVIFVWLPGGPPHMEMYDLKPEAPSDFRGEFRPIPTNVSGLEVGELLPLHAGIADKYNLVRSIAHEFADHGGGHKRFLTGRDPKEPTGFVNDFPMVGSVVAKIRESRQIGIPNYICGADHGRTGVDVFSFGASYLGTANTPFAFGGDPSGADFKIQNLALDPGLETRLDDRVRLLHGFDPSLSFPDHSGRPMPILPAGEPIAELLPA